MPPETKRVVSIPFIGSDKLNTFLSQNKIPRADIINLDYKQNAHDYPYILTFYAHPDLIPVINRTIAQNKRELDNRETRELEKRWQEVGKPVTILMAIIILAAIIHFLLSRYF